MEDLKKVEGKDFNVPEDKKKKGGCGKYIFFTMLLTLLVGGVIFWWKFYYNYGDDGQRTGLLQKFSHKGDIFKTYEGELVLSSVASTANVAMASEKFLFSVENDSIAKMLQVLDGKRVKVHYLEKKGTLPWRGDSKYIVDKVTAEPY
jgi:hypothetical protein